MIALALALGAVASYTAFTVVWAFTQPPTRHRAAPPVYPLDPVHYLVDGAP